jgi:SAM-dependent methyltransferase
LPAFGLVFAWLAQQTPQREYAWDCATGNGQAACGLAEHFARVIATDASAEQIANARPDPRIEYRVAPAESPDLAPASAALVTVAQAAHWFDRPRFYAAVRAALVPGGVIALWSYGLFTISRKIDELVENFYTGAIGPHWPPARRLIDEHYATLDFPFPEIAAPDFHMRASWTLVQVLAYLGTWSAMQRYRRAEGSDPLAAIAPELERLWGDAAQHKVSWPLYLRIGRNA